MGVRVGDKYGGNGGAGMGGAIVAGEVWVTKEGGGRVQVGRVGGSGWRWVWG